MDYSIKALNAAVFEKLASDDPALLKEAKSEIDEYTRTSVKEEGFVRKFANPQTITSADLDRQTWTDKNVKVVDKEPDTPPAVTVPYDTLPMNRYMLGDRYPVMMARIMSRRYQKDLSTLRNWEMDIRQVFSDSCILDIHTEEDSKYLTAVRSALINPGQVVPETGIIQWRNLAGGITRDNLKDAPKIGMQTPQRIPAGTCLINTIFRKDIEKMGRIEAGGDISERMLVDGYTSEKWDGMDLVVTIKRGLVADNEMFMFAIPKFLGKFFVLEEPQMVIQKPEPYMIRFYAMEEIGAAIGNVAAIAIATFTGASADQVGNTAGFWRY